MNTKRKVKDIKRKGALLIAAALLAAGCGTHKNNIATRPDTKANTTSTIDTTTTTPPQLPPKSFRGVWMATVANIDWPVKYITDARGIEREKATYRRYLDSLQALNINAVMFQVRPMADTFYASPYEPWSQYLSGTRGKDPGWDPLPWLISETHRRGMQFHAWLNPYRVAMRKDRRTPWPNWRRQNSCTRAPASHRTEPAWCSDCCCNTPAAFSSTLRPPCIRQNE